MRKFELLERRVFACAWAPHPSSSDDLIASPLPAASGAAVAAEVPIYNTPFLTDAQLEQSGAMTAAEVRAFLASRGSYFRQTIVDVDGVSFDPATVIASAAVQHRISPKVILATLQKEHSGVTRTTRPSDSQMQYLMGCGARNTARQQLACTAERFRSYQNSLINNGQTVSGWRVGVAKNTQDGVSVTPATRAVAGQFTYTPYAGAQWGGNLPAVGGVYIFYNAWNVFGFGDSVRPTATSNPGTYVAAGASSLTFTITYADAAGVDVSDVVSNNGAVRVTGPNGFDQPATFVSVSAGTDGTPRTATYRVVAPGGTWNAPDAGSYSIRVQEAQVSDVNNNFVAAGAIGTLTVVAPAAVAARHVFYNNSAFDGRNVAPSVLDDAALAPDKSPLLPGQAATFANVTSYTRGINGITIDLRGNGPTIGAADFTLRVGNSAEPSGWAEGPTPASILLRPGAGAGGSDRLMLTWGDDAVRNAWLQVTLNATANTRLAAPDVFYFGNLSGDAGGDALTVDNRDALATRAALSGGPAGLDSAFDHNRDGRVDVRDVAAARENSGFSLHRLGQPAPAQAPAPAAITRRTVRRQAAYVLY